MQPSQLEIQREVEALRDIRRRSTAQGGPGALILDPDLPNPTSPTSPTSSYWSAAANQQLVDGDSSSGSHEDSSSSEERAVASDDPSHLFWVPARLHPEIAPAEFRNFLKEHARTPPTDGSATVSRSSSFSHPSSGLGRKRSMLSRQYKPSESDDVAEEKILPMVRRRSTLLQSGPQLTINDLQRLEELAEEASKSDDPSTFRAVLRRSLTLNVAPSAIDRIDNISDEADIPIIVPPPGQILRRSARTKIRKASQSAEGAPHRFGPGRRHRAATTTEQRTSSDLSSNDHASSERGDTSEQPRRPRAFSAENVISNDVQPSKRPESFSEETSIYDSYVREESELSLTDLAQSLVAPLPALSFSVSADEKASPVPLTQEGPIHPPALLPPPLVPQLHHPQPQKSVATPQLKEMNSSDTSTLVPSTEDTLGITPSVDFPLPGKPASPAPRKKEKRGLFEKWSSDKNGKRNGKDKDREKDSQRGEKESGFFGSLFSKKKQDEQGSTGLSYSGSGREAVAALLGSSKSSKLYAPSPSPQPGPMGYARYPIHVERAIYRLSHIKLANPRRPLYEQVLISNLMFWYLGVINKTQNPAPSQATQGQSATTPAQPSPSTEKEYVERERREVDERQEIGSERLEREKQELKETQSSQPQQQKSHSRRGTLTKAASGQPGGRRTAEMPVKGPQYEMQHRVMEQEYNSSGFAYGVPPTSAGGGGGPRSHRPASPPIHSPQPTMQPDLAPYAYTTFGYDNNDIQHITQGTPQPAGADQSWSPSGSAALPPSMTRTVSPPQSSPNQTEVTAVPPKSRSQRRSRSPPSQKHNRYAPVATGPGRLQARGPGRSLSTGVVSQPLSSDGKPRKAASAHAVSPGLNGRPRASIGTSQPSRGEEEDVPLAVWQQQRRR